MGLLLKALYYQCYHPWMSVSQAYEGLRIIMNFVMVILVVMVIISMPLLGYFVATDKTTSTILYILTGLTFAMVIFLCLHSITIYNQLHA